MKTSKYNIILFVRHKNAQKFYDTFAKCVEKQTDKNFILAIMDNNKEEDFKAYAKFSILPCIVTCYFHNPLPLNFATMQTYFKLYKEFGNHSYLLSVDIDDTFSENYIEEFSKAINQIDKDDVIFGCPWTIGTDNKYVLRKDLNNPDISPIENLLTCQTTEGLWSRAYPLKAVIDNFCIDGGMFSEDYIFNIKVLPKYGYVTVPNATYHYKVNYNSITFQNNFGTFNELKDKLATQNFICQVLPHELEDLNRYRYTIETKYILWKLKDKANLNDKDIHDLSEDENNLLKKMYDELYSRLLRNYYIQSNEEENFYRNVKYKHLIKELSQEEFMEGELNEDEKKTWKTLTRG